MSLTGYDAYGRRSWEQVGLDAARRVDYAYNALNHATAPGLPVSVTLPGGAVEEFEYDARGNLSATETPLGFRGEVLSDAVGRVLRTRQPVPGVSGGWLSDTLSYDAAERVVRTVTSGPAKSSAPAQSLVVTTEYDAESRVTAVSRWAVPDLADVDTITTRWRYDLAGRAVVEVAPDGTSANLLDNPRDSTVYDLAGNVVAVHSRRWADSLSTRVQQLGPVTMEYDASNRLTKRRVPSVLYASRNEGIAPYGFIAPYEQNGSRPYPYHPNEPGGGYLIAGDSAVFGYDGMGNLAFANNGDVRIRRSYHPGGALRTDTMVVRTDTSDIQLGNDWDKHVYGLEHFYDRNGRRVDLKHPEQLAPRPYGELMDHTRWSYDRHTGALASVTDPLGAEIRFTYNPRGELERITRPTGVTQRFRYDADGRMLTDSVLRGSFTDVPLVLRAAAFEYDASGKLLWTRNGTEPFDSISASYNGLGHLASGFSSSQTATYK